MRVEATRPRGWLWVDWWLLNHCAWQCSYCPELLRTGSIPMPSLAPSLAFVDELVAYAASRGHRAKIKFTGGEPLEWTSLEDLLAYAHSQGVSVGLRTNANAGADRWADICLNLADVEMGYHPEHTQTSVYLLNLDRALAQGVNVRAVFNMLPTRFEETEQVLDKVRAKYPQVSIERRMLFEDPAINKQPMEYKLEHTIKLKRQHGELIYINNQGETELTDFQTLMLEGKNAFPGRQCLAGVEQLIVDAWGRIKRGHCGQGGLVGKLGIEFTGVQDPVICKADACRNGFDIQATKQ